MVKQQDLIRAVTAAAILGIRKQSFNYHINKGHFKYRLIDGVKYFNKSDIEAWREAKQVRK